MVTGSPYFDELYAKIQRTISQGSKQEQPYITFLSQPFTADGYLSSADYAEVVNRFYTLLPIAEKAGKKLAEAGRAPSSPHPVHRSAFDLVRQKPVTQHPSHPQLSPYCMDPWHFSVFSLEGRSRVSKTLAARRGGLVGSPARGHGMSRWSRDL